MNQQLEIGLHWAAVALYALSACLFIYGYVFKKNREIKWAVLITVVGLIPHTLALGLRWHFTGHGPFLRRYEVYSSDVWIGLVVFLLIQWRRPQLRPLGLIVLPFSFLLIGMGVMSSAEIRPLPETFHTFWLYVHIFFAKIAYGSTLIGTALAGIYLITGHGGKIAARWAGRLPERPVLDELSYRFIGLGFIMMGVMIAAGAIWADNAWGSYWSWDPVETWSLVSWITYGIYLHLRRMHGWQGDRAAWLSIISFGILLFAIFGIGIFYATGHSPYIN